MFSNEEQAQGGDGYPIDDEYFIQLTATFHAVDTLIAEATSTSAAKTQAASGEDLEKFCEIYSEYVNDVRTRVNEYEAIVASGGEAGDRPEQLEHSMERYMGLLVDPAPLDIRPTVESAASISIIGLFSSQEGNPRAEALLVKIDDYASMKCSISLQE